MGATIPKQFMDAFPYDEFGVMTGTNECTQFPTGSCGIIRFKTHPDNEGLFLLGNDIQGCIFPMSAGDDTGWISADDLNRFYANGQSGSSDYIYWFLQR